jgi:hypothetical protein
VLSGYWSAHWYNGHIYGSETGRGLDILDLKPSDMLTQNEIDAAKLVTFDMDNPQNQQKFVWPASFSVSRAYLDQLTRDNDLASNRLAAIGRELDRAEELSGAQRASAAKIETEAKGSSDSVRVKTLAASVRKLATAKS